jgi:energy-coupling factor transporter ATP-binding protein EcfA2
VNRIDAAKTAFQEILAFAEAHADHIRTEADARLQLIDRILIEVLGWRRENIATEPHTATGYVDYLLSSGERNVFVVEAKKTGSALFSTKVPNYALYKAGSPAFADARAGIEQAARYCFEKAVPYAALTNGHSWIGFRAVRTDGILYRDGAAAAFPSLESISHRFAEFYDLFSSYGVVSRLYNIYLDREEGGALSGTEPLMSVVPDTDIYMMRKSELAHDLDQVFGEFFKTITGDSDSELLLHCFVETSESHEADRSLQKITREIVNHVQSLSNDADSGLQREIETSFETGKGQIVLIVGNKGAGKSTFIDRFFRLVLDRPIRAKCLMLRIALEDASGSIEGLQEWLTDRLIERTEKELYDGRNPSYDELVGIFFNQYQRWSTGEFKHLYDTDPVEFRVRFGAHVFQQRQAKPLDYLISVLQRAARQRRIVPCIIFDNADNFPVQFQDAVFQYAYALYRAVLSVVVVPITDRTIWRLSKSGALQSYSAHTFYLPVPSTRNVLEKRVLFIKRKLEEGPDQSREYFSSRGLRITLDNMPAFAACVEEAFIRTDFISRRVGWLSNHDLRRSLQLSQQIITAPILKVDDLVAAYFATRSVSLSEMRVVQALLLGNYNKFRHDAHEFVVDLFRIERESINSPLLRMSLLRLLLDKENAAPEALGAYMLFEDIEHYFDAMGVSTRPLVAAVAELAGYRLIEPYEPNMEAITPTTRLAITFSGRMHLEMALNDAVYIEQMAQTTPIRSDGLVRKLRDLNRGKMRHEEWRQYRSAFAEYCLEQDQLLMKVPGHPAYSTQDLLRGDFRTKWCTVSA